MRTHRVRQAPTVSTQADVSSVAKEGRMPNLVTRKGRTRGKNPRDIEYLVLDIAEPDSLPTTAEDFSKVTGVSTESELVELLIAGFNQRQYEQASDEIGEYLNEAWDSETQLQFRAVVRNTVNLGVGDMETIASAMRIQIDKVYASAEMVAARAKRVADKARREAEKAAKK